MQMPVTKRSFRPPTIRNKSRMIYLPLNLPPTFPAVWTSPPH